MPDVRLVVVLPHFLAFIALAFMAFMAFFFGAAAGAAAFFAFIAFMAAFFIAMIYDLNFRTKQGVARLWLEPRIPEQQNA